MPGVGVVLPDASTVVDADSSSSRRWFPVALAVVTFSALSLAAGLTSDGFLEADACTHYLYARFALEEPHYFANVWVARCARGCTRFPRRWRGGRACR